MELDTVNQIAFGLGATLRGATEALTWSARRKWMLGHYSRMDRVSANNAIDMQEAVHHKKFPWGGARHIAAPLLGLGDSALSTLLPLAGINPVNSFVQGFAVTGLLPDAYESLILLRNIYQAWSFKDHKPNLDFLNTTNKE